MDILLKTLASSKSSEICRKLKRYLDQLWAFLEGVQLNPAEKDELKSMVRSFYIVPWVVIIFYFAEKKTRRNMQREKGNLKETICINHKYFFAFQAESADGASDAVGLW